MSDFIEDIIIKEFGEKNVEYLLQYSLMIKYLEKKTASFDKDAKARGSFGNLYAIYAVVKDYIDKKEDDVEYSMYEGMRFKDALSIARSLPFGEKLQNHALNHRCNQEFKGLFGEETEVPIIRPRRGLYKANEKLLEVEIENNRFLNIAPACIQIIKKYIELKQSNFQDFFDSLNLLKSSVDSDPQEAYDFIVETLKPSSDARIFEIASYVIMKYHYIDQKVVFKIGSEEKEMPLTIYKVSRTNANDGGIDYIMKPLGRIFQVTETFDFNKYFLDIDKLVHYPITFVIKQDISPEDAKKKIAADAKNKYSDETLSHYLSCFEEVITIPVLKDYLNDNIRRNYLTNMVDELIEQCKVEYNF
ncbi:MAG: hypothetical protein ACI4F9_08005 [Lachnospiraceae bacterium]